MRPRLQQQGSSSSSGQLARGGEARHLGFHGPLLQLTGDGEGAEGGGEVLVWRGEVGEVLAKGEATEPARDRFQSQTSG